MTKHSLNYVVHYIDNHLDQGHDLSSILDHLKTHNVDDETIHQALHQVHHKQYNQIKTTNKSAPSERFVDILTPAEYIVGASLMVLLFVTLFSDTAQTIAFLLTLVFVGYAYIGSSRIIEPLILITGALSVYSVLQQFTISTTLIYGGAYALLVFALHSARRPKGKKKRK